MNDDEYINKSIYSKCTIAKWSKDNKNKYIVCHLYMRCMPWLLWQMSDLRGPLLYHPRPSCHISTLGVQGARTAAWLLIPWKFSMASFPPVKTRSGAHLASTVKSATMLWVFLNNSFDRKTWKRRFWHVVTLEQQQVTHISIWCIYILYTIL